MKFSPFIPLFSILFFVFITPIYAQDESEPFAKVLYASESVQVIRKQANDPVDLHRGDTVYMDDKIMVGEKSRAILITKNRKLINMTQFTELKPESHVLGKSIPGMSLNMFDIGKGRQNMKAQEETLASQKTPILLRPRNSMTMQNPPVLHFALLEENQRYEVKIRGIVPPFVHQTTLNATNELVLNQEELGRELIPAKQYFASTKIIQATDVLQREDEITFGFISQEQRNEIEQVRKTLSPLMEADPHNPAYPTLLAETYEAHHLYHDAIDIYQNIYNEILPGDEYSFNRLKQLYMITQQPQALRNLTNKELSEKVDNPEP